MNKKEYIKKWNAENRERLNEYKRAWMKKRRHEEWENDSLDCSECGDRFNPHGKFKPKLTCSPECQETRARRIRKEWVERQRPGRRSDKAEKVTVKNSDSLDSLARAIVTGKVKTGRRLV